MGTDIPRLTAAVLIATIRGIAKQSATVDISLAALHFDGFIVVALGDVLDHFVVTH
jgi:hypothetical protein